MRGYGRPRRFRGTRRRNSERGLTLIELLVSLAILMILTSFIVGGLSTAIRAFGADRRNSVEVATNAAGESLRSLIASAIPAANALQAGSLLFDGQREELRFVALSEGRALRGGPQEIRIRRRDDELIIEVFGSLRESDARKSPVSSTTIVMGLRDIRFRYFGVTGAKGEAVWRDDWIKAGRLPALVEIGFNFKEAARNGPAVVVALRNEGAPGGS
ncbi:prepilin-type N-terminal cleavage/methylation domain-containing protein [Bradyrhizobium sp. CCGUVB14]|uniref:prepilin-type N-terminal cleavage/methylation domain-containing protein n=1 Tax=Bradyrhizobium sp. CCGUVB14 TaxID=2949628 RepID=UPI002113BE5B|nr:prepilin-type N-terminal cleavage/methylation domain-containing protein [Bradyrhizobium sp. CCGUVB14]